MGRWQLTANPCLIDPVAQGFVIQRGYEPRIGGILKMIEKYYAAVVGIFSPDILTIL